MVSLKSSNFKWLTPILHNLFQKIEEERTLPNSFIEICIILILKPKTGPKKKTTDQCLSQTWTQKSSKKALINNSCNIKKKNYTPQASEVYSRNVRLVQYSKINKGIPPY